MLGQAVAVRRHEDIVVAEPCAGPFQASAGLGMEPRVDQVELPLRGIAVMNQRSRRVTNRP